MPKPIALYYSMMCYQPENCALLDRVFDVIEVETPDDATEDDLLRTQVLFAPLGYCIDRERMGKCPKLKAIVSNTTGVPHIDMEEAGRRGVKVCALHEEQTFLDTITPSAEHAIGLMLAAWRRIPAAHMAATVGKWDRRPWGAPAMFSRLSLGLVGYGRLGRKTGEIARSMGMDVAWYDPGVEDGIDDMMQLARRSNVLSLHAVANEETHGLVSRSVLEALPNGAMVVNTARGELLDTEALLDLLESGHIRAAALDVVDGEYEPGFSDTFGDSRMARYAATHDNLILTPHIAGSTVDAWSETEYRVINMAVSAVCVDAV